MQYAKIQNEKKMQPKRYIIIYIYTSIAIGGFSVGQYVQYLSGKKKAFLIYTSRLMPTNGTATRVPSDKECQILAIPDFAF